MPKSTFLRKASVTSLGALKSMSATHMDIRSGSPYLVGRISHLEQFVPCLSGQFSLINSSLFMFIPPI